MQCEYHHHCCGERCEKRFSSVIWFAWDGARQVCFCSELHRLWWIADRIPDRPLRIAPQFFEKIRDHEPHGIRGCDRWSGR